MTLLTAKTAPHDSLVIRGARVVDPARGVDAVLDVRVDDGVIAQLGDGRRGERPPRRRRGRSRARAGLRRSARPPANARPRGRGDDRLRHARGRGRRLLRHPRHAEHGAGRRLGSRARVAHRAGADRGRGAGGLPRRDLEGPEGGELTEMGELARRRRRRLHRRRPPCRLLVADAAGAPVRRGGRAHDRRALRGADALANGPDARGRRARRSSASPATRRSAESVMVGRDVALAAYEGRPAPRAPRLGTGVGRGRPPRSGRRRRRHRGGHAAPSRAHGRGGAVARSRT